MLTTDQAHAWVDAFEDGQRRYAGAREERFAALVDAIAAAAERLGRPVEVLDVGAGPGVLARRLDRARVPVVLTQVEAHPLLAELARRVAPGSRVVTSDVARADWVAQVGGPAGLDVICAVTTLHYLPEPALAAFLREARRALRPGGLLLDGDHDAAPESGRIPGSAPTLETLRADLVEQHHRRTAVEDSPTWEGWWARACADPDLGGLVPSGDDWLEHVGTHERSAPEQAALMAAAGFAEVGELWRYGRSRLLVARA